MIDMHYYKFVQGRPLELEHRPGDRFSLGDMDPSDVLSKVETLPPVYRSMAYRALVKNGGDELRTAIRERTGLAFVT